MDIVLTAAKAKTGEYARTYKQALQFLDLEDLTEANMKPTDATIKLHINQYSVSDDPYDVASEIGKKYNWTQNEIEKAESIIRKKYLQ